MKNNILNQKLHRKGKQWFTVSATVLALLGAGSLASKSINADSFMNHANEYNSAHVNVSGLQNGYYADKVKSETKTNTVGDLENKYLDFSKIIGIGQNIKSNINNSHYTLQDAIIGNHEIKVNLDHHDNVSNLGKGNLNIEFVNGSNVNKQSVPFNSENVSNAINSLKGVNTNNNDEIDTSKDIKLTPSGTNDYTAKIYVKNSNPGGTIAPSGGSSNNNSSNNNNNKQNNNQNHNQNNNSQHNNNSNNHNNQSNNNSHKNNNSNNSQSKGKNANNVKKAQKSVNKAKSALKNAHSKKAKVKAEKQLKSAQKQVKQEIKINKASNNVQKAKAALKNAHSKKAKAKAEKQLKKAQRSLSKASGAKKYNKSVNKAKKQLKRAHSNKARAKAKKQLKQANAQLKKIKKMF